MKLIEIARIRLLSEAALRREMAELEMRGDAPADGDAELAFQLLAEARRRGLALSETPVAPPGII